jgi:hypothetical protein
MHMLGGPPQMDFFDYKPVMTEWYNKDLPGSVRQPAPDHHVRGQTDFPLRLPFTSSRNTGKAGLGCRNSCLTAKMVDEVILRSLHTDAINHEPRSPSFRLVL